MNLDDRIRQADPVAPGSLDDWGRGPEGRALLTEIRGRAAAEGASGGPRTVPRPGRRRWAALAGGAAALAVVIFVGTTIAPTGGPTLDAAAAQTLRATGRAAAAAEGPGVLQPGQYWYTLTEGVSAYDTDGGDVLQGRSRYEDWVTTDGSGRMIRSEEGSDTWEQEFGPYVRPAEGAAEALSSWQGPGFILGHNLAGTYDDLLALPTDPGALGAHIERSLEGYRDRPAPVARFVVVGDMLRQPLPPALRAALYEVAAAIPGVELVGETVDPFGRTATAVAMDDETGELREELLFDPATGAYVGNRRVLQREVDWIDAEPGETISYLGITASGIVDGTDVRP
jgi:RNA polymerase sigma-70 factor (ECF subfamily)